MTSTSFKHALSQLLLPPVIAQAILACILALLIYSLESSAVWVDHIDQVIARMNKLTRLMIDEETGIRGYLLTGRKEFLEPYDHARREIDPDFQQLQKLVNDPLQTERLRKLSADNDAWEAFATLRLSATRTREELVADSLSAKARMDQIREESDQFMEAEEVLRAQSSSSYARFRSRTTYILLPLLATLAAALIFMFSRKMFSKLAKMEHELQRSATEARARAAELEAIMQVVPAVTLIAHDTKCERVTSSLLAYKLLRLRLDKCTSFAKSEQDYRVMRNGIELAPEERPLQTVAATGREVRDFELTLPFDDGSSRNIFGNAVPLFDDSGTVRGAVGAFIDITDRKLAEETLRKTEKLAVVGRLAASLSHEINNPLESVTNLLYLVETASSMEQIREYTKMAQQELLRVSTIATQTLLFYRQSSRPTAVSVAKLLDSALSLYGRRFSSAGIGIERRYEDVASLFAYDGELRQVFVNLIGNAFDATRNVGTRVTVRERQVFNWKTGSKGIRITIADTGQGMSQGTLKRLFEPFFSTKGDTGTGLGLWITKGIVDKHRGSMQVRSSQAPQKQGTVFSIFFPFEGIPSDALSRAASTTQ